MEQKLEYFHTNKDLKQTKEILTKEGIEIILSSNTMYINISEMTEEEQNVWIKLMREDLEDAVEDVEIFYRKLHRFFKNKNTFPTNFRKMLAELDKSNNSLPSEKHRSLIDQLNDFEHSARRISYYENFRAHDVRRFGGSIRCSCIIAKKGNDIIRYLEFLKDPVVTIKGPNASHLKSTLESKF